MRPPYRRPAPSHGASGVLRRRSTTRPRTSSQAGAAPPGRPVIRRSCGCGRRSEAEPFPQSPGNSSAARATRGRRPPAGGVASKVCSAPWYPPRRLRPGRQAVLQQDPAVLQQEVAVSLADISSQLHHAAARVPSTTGGSAWGRIDRGPHHHKPGVSTSLTAAGDSFSPLITPPSILHRRGADGEISSGVRASDGHRAEDRLLPPGASCSCWACRRRRPPR
jgi:hypothetical protein